MKRHRFDPLSFVFGAIFLGIAFLVTTTPGTGVSYVMTMVDRGRVSLAGLVAIAGLTILGSTISAMMRSSDDDEGDQPQK